MKVSNLENHVKNHVKIDENSSQKSIQNRGAEKLVIKLLPEGIKVRILLRITGQPSNEAGFYNSNMAAETGLPIPKPYFIGYIRTFNLLSTHSMHASRLYIY